MPNNDTSSSEDTISYDARRIAALFDSIQDYEYYQVFLQSIFRKFDIKDTEQMRAAIRKAITEMYSREVRVELES